MRLPLGQQPRASIVFTVCGWTEFVRRFAESLRKVGHYLGGAKGLDTSCRVWDDCLKSTSPLGTEEYRQLAKCGFAMAERLPRSHGGGDPRRWVTAAAIWNLEL